VGLHIRLSLIHHGVGLLILKALLLQVIFHYIANELLYKAAKILNLFIIL